jgi:hypothetical protein
VGVSVVGASSAGVSVVGVSAFPVHREFRGKFLHRISLTPGRSSSVDASELVASVFCDSAAAIPLVAANRQRLLTIVRTCFFIGHTELY